MVTVINFIYHLKKLLFVVPNKPNVKTSPGSNLESGLNLSSLFLFSSVCLYSLLSVLISFYSPYSLFSFCSFSAILVLLACQLVLVSVWKSESVCVCVCTCACVCVCSLWLCLCERDVKTGPLPRQGCTNSIKAIFILIWRKHTFLPSVVLKQCVTVQASCCTVLLQNKSES